MTTQRQPRLDLGGLTPDAYGGLHELATSSAAHAAASGLSPALLELVRLRASQLNGCGFCLRLHTEQARAHGEPPERLDALSGWRDSTLFDESERVALDFAEEVTLLRNGQVGDQVYARASEHFDRNQLAHLLWTVALINTYNRLAITSGLS